MQHYFFEQDLLDRHHWNQAFLLEVQQALDPKLLEQAVQQLLLHHDALLRFEHTESGWQQINTKPEDSAFLMRGFVRSASFKAKSALEAAATCQPEFIARPLVRVALFNLGRQNQPRC